MVIGSQKKSAVGLMIAAGNIGASLQSNQLSTFFTRDAGVTWFKVKDGEHLYSFGDYGSLVVMVPAKQATNILLFSWNQGKTWTQCTFTDVPLKVSKIFIEPNQTSEKFVIYGLKTTSDSQPVPTVIYADFVQLHERTCQGLNNPGATDSDYEYFTPHGFTYNCTLGTTQSWIRRKQASECFNDPAYVPTKVTTACPCTRDDFECDECYVLDTDGKTCIPNNEKCEDTHTIPEPCKGTYVPKSAYRQIAGDQCNMKGVTLDFLPAPVKCPTSSSGSAVVVVVVLFLVIFVSGAITLVYFIRTNEQFRDWVGSKVALPSWLTGTGAPTSYSSLQTNPIDDDDELLDDSNTASTPSTVNTTPATTT